ncbi:MAG: Rrf2 family transcriptional regulator [Rhodospirillaceae bacterium]|jgi:Rrf2 family transcriptional regulator, iron-sulfur cluster assembly transcription factor|nr:Rrf2 family transcriptional regulator [Rhodospirillaceae bacterium]MBT5897808.1 Rrf2 family transcriptional regulator [Rhodospirillaceae bacterium]MBT6428105.1 Rrf2 family transcriptional regulator [Rhodospirillaceae bacterium]MBT7760922.1 Rrf2 family transcriptional regulator [Rhodospirillaceae bacterium]
MPRLSKKTMYVLEAVLDIACNARPNPVQSKDIAQRQGIPQRYLEGALQHLVRAGILRGVRGPKGGYRLARERRRITVAEVVRLMEDLDDQDEDTASSPLGRAVVQPLWDELHEDMLARLEGVSLEDLFRQARRAGVADGTKAGGKAADFDI